ncbi:MAG: hypothetical protein LPK45_12275 [Bacteroidota bacterium]|nr:hypothetical protein [Bacteroidota bacterium]MDX5431885.1 hypothetical protein [Bacteroidota bacterium]MDX5470599.1 hypothetical protein [Bacteroidota bacterium]
MLTLSLMLFVACSKSEDPAPAPANTDNKYMGTWQGVFSGGDNGTWSMTVDKAGAFTGELYSGNAAKSYPFTGSISAAGVLTADINVEGVLIDFDGQGSEDGKTANGTWGNTAAMISGVWQGAKQ